ncbi:MAG: hypothetical protein P8N00_01315 [Flavobacteriales bacterium]|nr:hypothetical protein [Flavobacteriales bacterium]
MTLQNGIPFHHQVFDWCTDKIESLYAFLDGTNSKSFILLKDGKIVLK